MVIAAHPGQPSAAQHLLISKNLIVGWRAGLTQARCRCQPSHISRNQSFLPDILSRITRLKVAFAGDGAFDQDHVYASVTGRHPQAAVIVPPRSTAVPSEAAESPSTQRERHFLQIAEHGRIAWQTTTGYIKCSRVGAAMSRWKPVIEDKLRMHTDELGETEVAVAVHVLDRMLELGRPNYVRIA